MRQILLAALVLAFIPSANGVTVAQSQEWEFKEYIDPLDDSASYIASVDAIDGSAVFWIKCDKAGDPSLGSPYVSFAKKRTYLGDDDSTRIRYRIDKNDLVEDRWKLRGGTVHHFSPSSIIEDLKVGETFIIEVLDYNYKSHRGTFSLKGSSEAISAMQDGCKG